MRRMTSLLCVLCLLVMIALPAKRTTAADVPFSFKAMSMDYSNYPNKWASSGDIVKRGFSRLNLYFSYTTSKGSEAKKFVKITDSKGNAAPLVYDEYQTTPYTVLPFVVTGPLSKNETYTVTITGGPTGLHDAFGKTLASDVTLTFTTDSSPFTSTYSTPTQPAHGNSPEIRTYRIYAGAGSLQLTVDQLRNYTYVTSRVYDLDQNKVIDEPEFSVPDDTQNVMTSKSVTLPHAGWYTVSFNAKSHEEAQNTGLLKFTFSGPELVVPDVSYVQPVSLEQTPYTFYDTPFTTKAVNLDLTNKPKAARLFLDGEPYKDLAVNSDNSFGQASVDVTALSDGLHSLFLSAEGPYYSENEGSDEVPFLVDRVDNFSDVPKGSWMRKSVEFMSDEGILQGVGNKRFEPDRAVTREEFSKMLATTLGMQASTTYANPFADVAAGTWSYGSINALAEQGLISGETRNGKRYFRPGDSITRAEATVIIGRQLGITAETAGDYEPPFRDFASVPDWAKPQVAVMQYYGWVNGSNGTFLPNSTLTRAEAAQILSKYLGI
ncbi:S-layer homology domain-containing protein [Tumebacillus sp. ITR2]|uniref:S-layer homology domain-containing protein n=1 Tax=Tumebacillus amylolyticus TaxID=2801339 RepID=A0ABS1JHJ8_9BACL|nr:S-layer homology domain-containing protein [Tumebacillus amylolyticus]MBL0389203.1 S-layer homology domain-containing protein [Tumebacillus amylolyticus]